MTDTTTLAPTDAELVALAEDFDVGYMSRGRLLVGTNPDCDFTDEVLAFARTVLAKWGAPTPQGDGVPTWQAAQDPMLECSIQPRPLSHPLAAYHSAMSKGPLHYTWQDKPHRLVYDLIAAVKHYANQAGQAAPAPVAEDAEDAARWRTAVDTTDPTQGNAA